MDCSKNSILNDALYFSQPIEEDAAPTITKPDNYDWKLDGIWVIGGRKDTTNLINTIDVYDPYEDEWHENVTTLPIPTPVRNAFITSYYDYATGHYKIYIMGGINSGGAVINTVQEYNVTTDTWTTLPAGDNVPASAPKQGGGVVKLNSNIYIFGGSTANSAASPVQTAFMFMPYNSSGSRWSASMGNMIATALSDFGFVILDGEIIVGGGRTNAGAPTNQLSGFYPTSKLAIAATSFSVLKVSRYGLSASVYYDTSIGTARVFFIGGTNVTNTGQPPVTLAVTSKVDIYVPYSENGIRVMVDGPNLNQARAYHSSVTKGNYIFVFGGLISSSTLTNSVERLNASSSNPRWRFVKPMPTPRYGFSAITLR